MSAEDEESIPAAEVVRYLRDLPETWRKAADGSGRRLLASALFDRIEVLGLREATVHLSDNAVRHGLAAALAAQLGIVVSGRGERASPSLTQPSPRLLRINRTPRESIPAKARSA